MIPFVNLQRLFRDQKSHYLEMAGHLLSKGELILGPTLAEFEKAFTGYTKAPHGLGVANGTDALSLALKAQGIGNEDEVIVPAMTYFGTAEAVAAVGAQPVPADVHASTHLMAPEHVTPFITKNTRAVIVVCLYGFPMDPKPWAAFAKEKKLVVIVDAAQAHGARFNGKSLGEMPFTVCYSFYPSKNLGAFGDGGFVTTSSRSIHEKLERLRNHGARVKYDHRCFGQNSRLDALQAGFLKLKLPFLDEWNETRRQLSAIYREKLSALPLRFPHPLEGSEPVYHLYTVQTSRRNALQRFLAQKGIQTGVHYPSPLHTLPPFERLGYKKGDFPVSEQISKTTLSLPLCPFTTPKEIRIVCQAIQDFFKQKVRI